MRTLVVDFETRWDRKNYTLSKLTTEEYIRDPRFKAFGLCVKSWAQTMSLYGFLTKIFLSS